MPEQRIPYFPLDQMDDAMRDVVRICAEVGTPRPESSSVRAHSPGAFWAFDTAWNLLFRGGVVDHAIKELCRIYVSRSVKCAYCGNQRSEQARAGGFEEGKVDELLNFESSPRFNERERIALTYAEAITWRLELSDEQWSALHAHYSNEELVELAGFICLTMGQQSWLRLLNIDHHQVLPGTASALAEGFETSEQLAASVAREDYWLAQ